MYNDKNLTCADCGQEFVFTASEQDFYSQRGFTEPRRCPSCRASRKAARNATAAAARTAPAAATAPAVAIPAAPAATAAVAVAATIAVPARCSPRPARPAARKPRSRSARPAASRSIAATASAASAAADQVLDSPLGAGRPTARRTSVDPRPGPSVDPGRSILRAAARTTPIGGPGPCSRPTGTCLNPVFTAGCPSWRMSTDRPSKESDRATPQPTTVPEHAAHPGRAQHRARRPDRHLRRDTGGDPVRRPPRPATKAAGPLTSRGGR